MDKPLDQTPRRVRIDTDRPPNSEPMPEFMRRHEIKSEAERINNDLREPILEGIGLFLEANDLTDEHLPRTPEEEQIWLLAVKSSKYNAVYFVSREEAAEQEDFIEEYADQIDAVGELIDQHGGVAPIANFATHKYVQNYAEDPDREVMLVKKSTPSYAIQGYDRNTIAVKSRHFIDESPESSFESEGEIHDWHDMAHILAAASSDGKFGVKYHDGLGELPRYYRALTEGSGAQDASGPEFSDGLLFSQLSRPIFESYEGERNPDGTEKYTAEEIQELVTAELVSYLSSDNELFHPGTKTAISAERPMSPLEVAVAIQNKRYERRAAETEKFILARGTPEGSRGNPDKDPMHHMTRSERLQYIANQEDPLYFETRNLTRHRAHEDALGRHAHSLLNERRQELEILPSEVLKQEVKLLEVVVDFYHMNDLYEGDEINLYQMVGDILDDNKV